MNYEPGILFWAGAAMALVSAVMSIRLNDAVRSVAALMFLLVSLAIVLVCQGAVGIGIVTFLILGPVTLSFFIVALVSRRLSQPIRFSLSKFSRIYLFVAAIIFLTNLYLVAQTGVWQYAWEDNVLTLDRALELTAQVYFLPVLSLLFLILFLAGWAVSLKRRKAI